jgi:hypothetical protein
MFDRTRMALDADLFEAANDEEALAQATRAARGKKAELWEGQRLVAALGSEAPPPAGDWDLQGTLSASC